MKQPILTDIESDRSMIDVFGGYNHNLRIQENEFYDMENMTSDYYPILSPRGLRGTAITGTNIQGITVKDALCYVDGEHLYVGDYTPEDSVMDLYQQCNSCPIKNTCPKYKQDSTNCRKSLVSMGAYLIILPDKKYINTKDFSDYGSIEASFTSTNTVTYELCRQDSRIYGDVVHGDTPPEIPESGDVPMWLDTSTTPHSLKLYSRSTSMWTSIATTYIKISSVGIGAAFNIGDGVTLSGIAVDQLADLNNTMVIQDKGEDFITVIGIIDETATQEDPITVQRRMPVLDYVVEANNRLWGCRYGTNINGDVVNEIYASKLGDFKNWNVYAGVSTDSYIASCGTDGQWTGAVTHLGYPIFFKETVLHKVYGNFPSNFQIQSTPCRGVEKGSENSLAIVNEVLYYKGINGIMAYDGSLPQEISPQLGETRYKNAIAGSNNNKYYVSMQDASNDRHLFIYDTQKGLWHKESDPDIYAFASLDGKMLYVADNAIVSMSPDTATETNMQWSAETGVIGMEYPDRKSLSRILLRLSADSTASLTVSLRYDEDRNSDGEIWHEVLTLPSGTARPLRTFTVSVRPRRCDHFRMKLVGTGDVKIYSITKTLEQGSDLG